MYRVRLTDQQRDELHRLCHDESTKPKTRTRLEMVRLSHTGWSIPRIARHFDITESRTRHWIKAFLAHGFEGLVSKQSPGPPVKLTPDILASLQQMLDETDQTWTAPQLQQWLRDNHHLTVNRTWLSEVLTRNALSYKRTTRTVRHKQSFEQVQDRKADLETLKKGHGRD
jgi:transposase